MGTESGGREVRGSNGFGTNGVAASIMYYFNLFTFFRLLSGQERHEISYAMLVFDATKEVGYKGPGAHHAEIRKEPPRGLALYPIVFSHPWEDPEELKPSLISAITENNLDLKTCNKVVFSYDQRVCTAFINEP